jgi:hypothetical protein
VIGLVERLNFFSAEEKTSLIADSVWGEVWNFWKLITMAERIKTPASAASERIISLTNHLKNSLNPADDIQKAKMSASYKFQGWMGLDKDSFQGKMEWQEFDPKTWTEDDVDIKITHCGVCGSDIHVLRQDWVCLQQ